MNSVQGNHYQGTVLLFHGNAGSAIDRSIYVYELEQLGYRVIIAEYPGYGARTGEISESAWVNDGIATTQLAYHQFGDPIFLWGESLGGGVVSGIVKSKQVPIAGIVLLMPFDNLPNIAQTHYWFVMGKWLTLDKYDNIGNLRGYSGNIAVLIADQDKIIPNKHTLKLYDSIETRKKLWRFGNTDHNNLLVSTNQRWWREVMQFVDDH